MLKAPCQRFRESYEPGALDPHRHTCGPCSDYAAMVDQLATMGSRLPMSPGLGAELRKLSRQTLACREADRLWLEERPSAAPSQQLLEHRRHCRRCAALELALESVRGTPLSLPKPLRRRLVALPQQAARAPVPEKLQPLYLPAAILSWQRTAVASCLLALSLALWPGDLYALGLKLAKDFHTEATGVVLQWEAKGQTLFDSLSAKAQTELDQNKARFGTYWQDFESRMKELRGKLPGHDNENDPLGPSSDFRP